MAGKDIIMMSGEELRRLEIVKKVLKEGMKQVKAAAYMELSGRQVNRIIQRVRAEGARGVGHRLRGRASNHRIADGMKEKIIGIYRSHYKGFGPTLASEKIAERQGFRISDETLRKWLLESGDWQKRRGNRMHRHWRERKPRLGDMVQMDGSHHRWLEDRGPQLVLLAYIDDATGRVFGRFYPYEGTMPAMDSFKRYIRQHGIPQILYLDKHTAYKSWAKPSIEDDLAGREPMSHFERALKELGVRVIHANSPQAKGRIERLFKTLQDRLIKEMRLRGIKTQEEANKFLGRYLVAYNRRFSVEAREQGDAHLSVPKGMDLDRVLCAKTAHPVRNDFTVVHDRKLYQLRTLANPRQVVVEERINGSLKIYDRDTPLRYSELHEVPRKEKRPTMRKLTVAAPSRKHVPAKNHPWRKSNIYFMGGGWANT